MYNALGKYKKHEGKESVKKDDANALALPEQCTKLSSFHELMDCNCCF